MDAELEHWKSAFENLREVAAQAKNDQYVPIYVTGRASVVKPSPPPLNGKALAVYELLLECPPHRAMTGTQIIEALYRRGIDLAQSTLTKYIIPKLRAHGVRNHGGYYIPAKYRL